MRKILLALLSLLIPVVAMADEISLPFASWSSQGLTVREDASQPWPSGCSYSYHPYMSILMNDVTNPMKTGIYIENINIDTSDIWRVNEGIAVFGYSQPDNGHDVSGILSVQMGNGNAATFQKLTKSRFTGLPEPSPCPGDQPRNCGFATEVYAQGDSTAMLVSAYDNGIGIAVPVGNDVLGSNKPEGIRIFPRVWYNDLDKRTAILVSSAPDNLVDRNKDAFSVTLDGSIVASKVKVKGSVSANSLAGKGNAFACVNQYGRLYRSLVPCK
jgi:hypothetical protein